MTMFRIYHIVAAILLFLSPSLATDDNASESVDPSTPASAGVRGRSSEQKQRKLVNPDTDDVKCFSGIMQVQVKDKGLISMSDLQVGDHVLTGSGYYQPVYAFGHRQPTRSTEFLQIQTEGSKFVEMTASHLVFVDGKTNPVRADAIEVGDVLLKGGENGKVLKIETVTRDGIYAPMTPDGTIVLENGIVASSYASFQDHSSEFVEFRGGISTHLSLQCFIHMASSPFRLVCMGISPNLCNVYNEDGVPVIASNLAELGLWVDKKNLFVQIFIFVLVGAVTGLSLLVENAFGPSYGPLFLSLLAGFYILMKWIKIAFRGGKA